MFLLPLSTQTSMQLGLSMLKITTGASVCDVGFPIAHECQGRQIAETLVRIDLMGPGRAGIPSVPRIKGSEALPPAEQALRNDLCADHHQPQRQ